MKMNIVFSIIIIPVAFLQTVVYTRPRISVLPFLAFWLHCCPSFVVRELLVKLATTSATVWTAEANTHDYCL